MTSVLFSTDVGHLSIKDNKVFLLIIIILFADQPHNLCRNDKINL